MIRKLGVDDELGLFMAGIAGLIAPFLVIAALLVAIGRFSLWVLAKSWTLFAADE